MKMTYEIDKKDYYIIKRKQKKILLKDLAEYIGCSIAHVSRWENNLNNMVQEKEQKYFEYIDGKI